MRSTFFNSEIQNIETVFNTENPKQTTTDVEELIYYCSTAIPTYTEDEETALQQINDSTIRMQSPLNKNGEFAYYYNGTVVNLSFLYQFNYPDKMNLGEVVVILRHLREKMTENITVGRIENFKLSAKTINKWLFFLENL